MELEYKIIYKIGGDIPINPAWIRDQIRAESPSTTRKNQ